MGCSAGMAVGGGEQVQTPSLKCPSTPAAVDCVKVNLTMCHRLPAAGHDAVTQLDDLGDADDLLGVVALVRQQHQEEEDVGNDGF